MRNHSAQRYRRIGELCKDDESWRWVWRPREQARCHFGEPPRAELCRRFSGRRILLYGDSLARQHMTSLVSLLGRPVEARRPEPCSRKLCKAPLGCVTACGGRTLVCYRFGYGLVTHGVASPPPARHGCKINATVVTIEAAFPPACLRAFDVVTVGTWAHWAGVDGAWGLETCLRAHGGQSPHGAARAAQKWILDLHNRTVHEAAAFLQSDVVVPGGVHTAQSTAGPLRPRVLFVTSAPGVPPPDVLAPDAPATPKAPEPRRTPPTQWQKEASRDFGVGAFRAPRNGPHAWAAAWRRAATSPFNHHMVFDMNDAARAAAAAHRLEVLDLEGAMLARVDGHLVDRLHYCLPGPPDFFAYALAASVDW